jgi:hypothetical protein
MSQTPSIANQAATALPGTTPVPASGDQAAVTRAIETLERLESLTELLAVEDGYEPATLDYPLPPKFKLTVVIPAYNEERTIRQGQRLAGSQGDRRRR